MTEVFTVWMTAQDHGQVGLASCWVTNQLMLTVTPPAEMESYLMMSNVRMAMSLKVMAVTGDVNENQDGT